MLVEKRKKENKVKNVLFIYFRMNQTLLISKVAYQLLIIHPSMCNYEHGISEHNQGISIILLQPIVYAMRISLLGLRD